MRNLVGFVVLFFLAACAKNGDEANRKGGQTVPVVVANVEQRALPVTLTALGTVESTGSVSIQPRVDGQITQVFVRDGSDVRAGQPLLQIDPEPLRIKVRAAQAALARDTALHTEAAAKEARGRAILEQNYISKDEYQQLKAQLDSAAATVKADEAALDDAKLQLAYSTVRAPMAGRIGRLALKAGNLVRAASAEPLTTLNALDEVEVSFSAPEQSLTAIRQAFAAKTAHVTVPVAGLEPLAGRLSFVDNAVDRTSGTIGLRATFANRGHALWPGQFVTVSLALGSEEIVTAIPSVAISQGPEGPYVFVVGTDNTAQQRTVKTGRTSGELTVVSGVNTGERVVVDGRSRLAPGSRVSLRPAGPADSQPPRT